MKRFHVHLAVADMAVSIDFYTRLLGQAPGKRREDYARWLLDDPPVNFAISARGHGVGVNHLGIQADSADALAELRGRAATASAAVLDQPDATCCYAHSVKHWTVDPQGLAWEHFHTVADAVEFGADDPTGEGACCIPLHRPASTDAPLATGCCVPASSDRTGACCG